MRVQRFVVFNGHEEDFGYPVPTVNLRPVATPQPFHGWEDFGRFGGAWEDWCDQNYYTEENNAKCKNCNTINIPLLGPRCSWPDPKTVAGRVVRHLPSQTDLERLGPPSSPEDEIVTVPETGASPDSGGNKTLLIVGGVAVLSALAFAFRGRGRRMNGLAGFFGFGSRRTRRRKARRS